MTASSLKKIILAILLLGIAFFSAGQEKPEKEELHPAMQKHIRDIKRATLLSAAVPGAGQIYNGSYWKVPILYAGIGALVYFIDYNHNRYKYYKELYVNVDAPGPSNFYDTGRFQGYSNEQLKEAFGKYMDDFRRYRDLNIIGLAALYAANIVDANVDAYFKEYDVSEDLGLRVVPAPLPGDMLFACYPGISIRLRLK